MKKFKCVLLTALILSTSLPLFAQVRVGGGGSGDEAQLAAQQAVLVQVAQKIKLFFTKNKTEMEEVFGMVDNRKLVETISKMSIEVTNDELIDRHNKIRTCLNFSDRNFVQCNYSLLQKIEQDPKTVFVLMFHELLGLMELEETSPENPANIDGYKISKNIALYVTKVSEYDLKLPEEVLELVLCGNTGSVKARIQDCSKIEGSKKGHFVLVSRVKKTVKKKFFIHDGSTIEMPWGSGYDVWKDTKSNLIWTDPLLSSNNSASRAQYMDHYAAEDACQYGFGQYEEKAGISDVTWRLPSVGEYKKTYKNRMLVKDGGPWISNFLVWTSSKAEGSSFAAWAFNESDGNAMEWWRFNHHGRSGHKVRCVANVK